MAERSILLPRRAILKGLAAGAATAIARPAFALPDTIKIGLVGPKTGPLALFYEEMSYAIEHFKKATGSSISINGAVHPVEFVVKDSQSNPNRASEVAQELILRDKVQIVTTFATPETVNPVADQCELNGVPCVSNDDPIDAFFFGRHGDPKKGFDWTYNFFFSGAGINDTINGGLARLPTNKVVGALLANDVDGRILARNIPPSLAKAGFRLVDPGRFDLPANSFSSEIEVFKSAGVEIVVAVIPGPDFTVFFNQAAQQGFKPKVIAAGKVDEFPQGVYPYGDRAINFLTEVWWSKFHPYASGLTGQSSMEFAEEYEKVVGQQASMGLGFRHSLLEVAADTLKRSQKIDDPASIRDALRETDYRSIVGPVNFKTGPLPNCSEVKMPSAQWRKGKKWPLELVIVDNTAAPNIPVQSEPEVMKYS